MKNQNKTRPQPRHNYPRLLGLVLPEEGDNLPKWRELIFSAIIAVSAVFGLFSLIPNLKIAVENQQWSSVSIYLFLYTIWVIILFVHRIPFKVRVWAGIFTYYLSGLVALVTVGPVGSGRIYLIAAGLVISLMLGLKSGLIMLIWNIGTLILIGWLMNNGIVTWVHLANYTVASWITSIGSFFLLSTVTTIPPAVLVRQFELKLIEEQRLIQRMETASIMLEQEIAERKQAEEALREEHQRLTGILEGTNSGTWEWNVQTGETIFNECWAEIIGYTLDEISPISIETWMKYAHPDDLKVSDELLEKHFRGEIDYYEFESRMKHKDGNWVWVLDRGKVTSWTEDGKPLLIMGTHQDITERKQAEAKLAQTHNLLTNLARLVPGVIYQYRLYPDGRSAFPYSSPGMYAIYEVTPEEVQEDATPVFGRLHPEDSERVSELIFESARTLEEFFCEFRVILPEQGLRWRWSQAHPERTADGGTLWHGIISDITERKQAEEELKGSKIFLDNMSDIAYTADDQGNLTWANSAFERITGLSLESTIGKPFLPLFIEDDHQSLMDKYTRTLMGESLENTLTFASGVTCHFTSLPDRDSNGEITGTFGVARNITERLAMERALQVSENRLIKAQSVARIGNWEYDISTGKVWGSEEAFRLYGFERKSEYLPLDEVEAQIIEAERVNQALVDLVTMGKEYDIEFQITQKSSKKSITIHSLAELVKDDEGNPIKVTGVIQDITERKQAEEIALASQKMASLGRLAAGMAHEINSPLQLVTGLSERLTRQISRDDYQQAQFLSDLERISKSGWRIANIVRSLLTYARQTGHDFQENQLNDIITETLFLIEHQYRSWSNITIQKELAEDLPPTQCDKNSIIQVIINLLENARDAMPKGGEITIRTGYEEDTKQFMLQVHNTGDPIPENIQSKIFDPFFTTKGIGKGTGLGLSIVQGIITAHGGDISVESLPGEGTTFTFHLPQEPTPADLQAETKENHTRYDSGPQTFEA